jgi:general stress protein 26
MIDKMKQIVMDEKYCVLATAMNNKPHCSLMAYAVGEDCKRIYMVTQKKSEKYRNLTNNSSVSLLIDTRGNKNEKTAKALTISGLFSKIDDKKTLSEVKNRLKTRHPELEVFLNNESSCVFAVEIQSFLLLDGFTDAHFESFL